MMYDPTARNLPRLLFKNKRKYMKSLTGSLSDEVSI
jgi:hypothetical protein